MESEIAKIYGNRVRVRVCGLCRIDNKLLLVNHMGLSKKDFWAPPGGGLEFGQSITEALSREFMEETNLVIAVGEFAFGCEYIQSPLHAVELFFNVQIVSGTLKTGVDPELQIIRDVAFLSADEIRSKDPSMMHGIFNHGRPDALLRDLQGFYQI